MRIAFEIMAILESARFALVSVDSKHSRGRFGAHQRPLAAGREPGATKTAQPGIANDLDELVTRTLLGETAFQQSVAAGFLICRKICFGMPSVRVRFRFDSCG